MRRERPRARRGRAWRRGSASMKKQRSPGPAAYNIKSTVCSDAPAYSFGTMKRPAPNSKGISPGPVYQLKASLGRNKDITFKALPAFGFGTSERPDPGGGSALRESEGVCPPARTSLRVPILSARGTRCPLSWAREWVCVPAALPIRRLARP